MGHVQSILNKRKKAQTATPSASAASTKIELPGLHRREKLQQINADSYKREYNRPLKELRDLTKKISSLKGDQKKLAVERKNALKVHMADLLTKIGAYTHDEEMYGFKEASHEF